jgi:protein-L-isoaspartate(D-aspartate) O-methyltransferase
MPLFYSMNAPRRRLLALIAGFGLWGGQIMTAEARDAYAIQRKQMVDDIVRITHMTRQETGRARLSERVLAAMTQVPRHRFVPASQEYAAYQDRPLAIGSGQTISQPFIVALMTDLMDTKAGDRVLEVGTGSGYQAAILSELVAEVYTIEIIEALGRDSAVRFAAMGYRNIHAKVGDGYQGWPEHAPFDSIMVTAAARDVPPALTEQLKPGGRLVIPVGSQSGSQTLYVIDKQADGSTTRRSVLGVRFVPLTDKSGRQQ